MLSIRKIGIISRTYRHLNRYRQILAILLKYGFGDLIDRLKIDQYIDVGLKMISKNRRLKNDKLTRAERVRLAFEELGPTYIKLGQILSTRPDLIPVDFLQELAKLQDDVPPCPFAEIAAIIQEEFKQPLENLYDSFETTPVASASIGQVHKACLKDGEAVAIKVQRPGIRKRIEVDLEIMLHLATLMERHIEEMALHRPVKIVEEFARTLEKEIDYTIEAANLERFAQNFLDDPTVYVPKVYRDASATRVLTMEVVEGIKISELESLQAAGLDPKLITTRGADLILKQVFNHGFFHADPHPGNIFVLPNNVICLLDFGMVGRVNRQTREDFVNLIDGVVNQNETGTTHALLKLTTWDQEPDSAALERDVADFMARHLYKPLKDIQIGKLLQHLLELVSRHRLRFPPDIFLMLKAVATVEGIGHTLDPDFDMIARCKPFAEQIKLARFYPQRLESDLMNIASNLIRFLQQFPKDMLELSRLAREQKLGLKLEHQGLEAMRATQDQTSNRISFSIIIAALIIGSALIVISEIPPLVFGISLIGILVFFAAGIMGIWLLIAIIRRGSL